MLGGTLTNFTQLKYLTFAKLMIKPTLNIYINNFLI